MSSLDWPNGFERTPAPQRGRNRNYQTTLGQTTSDLETEMDRLDPNSWRASIANQHTKSNGLPLHNANPDDPGFVLRWTMDGEQFAVACDRYSRLRDNVRTVYLWVHETRMRGQRPVETGEDEFAAARLPSGEEDEDVIVAGTGETKEPHEVLGVALDAPDAVVKGAYRELLKERHPDHGGTQREFKELQQAKQALLGGGR